MEKYANFEQAQRLFVKGFVFDEPTFGDVFYTVHPDTGTIDNIVVGSGKWQISEALPIFRAPSLQDLMKLVGDKYSIRYEKNSGYWTIEKTKLIDFTVEEDYMVTSFPVGRNENPIDLLVDLICD